MGGIRQQLSPDHWSPPSDNESGAAARAAASNGPSKDQDRSLPIANVGRIMKKSLPANAKISKEAKETVQECVSEFIIFITGEASDKCRREKRKTINGDDLLWAMTTLGFENYVGLLKHHLNKYRETEGEKISMARQGDHESLIDQESNKSAAANHNTNTNGVIMTANPTANNPGLLGYSSGFCSAIQTSFSVGESSKPWMGSM